MKNEDLSIRASVMVKAKEENSPFNEVKIELYKGGALSLSNIESGRDDFIYLYPEQLAGLKAILTLSDIGKKED